MKSAWALWIPGILALVTAGCQRPLEDRPAGVKVAVEGGGSFPDALAGRWVADRHGWELVFGPDGRIASAVISLGRVKVTPGRTTTLPTRSGRQAVFTPGPWTVYYEPAARELTVTITMAHVRAEIADNVLEGSSTDVFSGPVSAEEGIWQAQWTAFTKYTARTPQNTSIDLSTDPVYGETQPVTFTRIAAPHP